MQTVTINGKTYNGHCLYDEFYLYVYLDNMSIVEGFPIFSDPTKLAVIHESSYGHERDYAGFTQLKSISGEYGNCNAVLGRAESDA